MYQILCLCSLMVKQRIYIPCATDNWPMWVRLPPEAPINVSLVLTAARQSPKLLVGVRIPRGTPNDVRMAERPNATVCKTVKPSVRIRLLTPDCPYGQIGKGGSLKRSVITIGSNPIRGTMYLRRTCNHIPPPLTRKQDGLRSRGLLGS